MAFAVPGPANNMNDYNQTPLIRRTLHEIRDLRKYPNIKSMKFIFPFEGDPLPKYANNYGNISKDSPYLKIKIDNNELIFAFHNSYPFKPPTLFINNVPWQSCYKISDTTAIIELQRKLGMKCLCCETRLCPGKGLWSPTIHITDILNEYKFFKKVKQYLLGYCNLLKINKFMDYQHNLQLPVEIIEIICNYLWLIINPSPV